MEIRGSVTGVWLNEEDENKPARIRIMGTYYSTFEKEILEPFQYDDLVEIQYHTKKGREDIIYNMIDSIAHIRDIEKNKEHIESKGKSSVVLEARQKINKTIEEFKQNTNKVLDELEEDINGT